jgi:nitrite reductase/ring-hydroxylating ferredoxin subunit
MGTYIKVAQKSELDSNAGKLVQAGGKDIALIRAGDNFFAIDNECSHVGGPLCEGTVSGDEVVCPWHAARFNLTTGKAMAGPARSDLHSYTVRVQGDDVEVEV